MKRITFNVKFLIGFIVALWAIDLADLASGHLLDGLGAIQPRSEIGLLQIFSAPFLHLGIAHVLGNTLALIPLGAMMLVEGAFWPVTAAAIVVGGLGTWAFAAGPTLGFSGVLFGFMGYLVARGFYTRQPRAVLWSVVVMFYFGGVFAAGLVPQQGVSWCGHFWGFVGGALAAKFWGRKRV